MQYVLAHEYLVGHAHHLILAVLVEHDDVVDVGAVAHELVFLQSGAYESLLPVDVKFLVGLHHLRGLDGVEVAYLGEPRVALSILLLEEGEPPRRHLHHVCKVALYLVHLAAQPRHQLVGLLFVELQYPLHLYFEQSQQVVARHGAHHLGVVRRKPLVDVLAYGVDVWRFFKLLVLIDALFDEYLFERAEVQLLQQLAPAYLQLAAQEAHRAVNGAAQHVAHREELRLVVGYHAAVGRYAHLAV